MVSVYVAEAGDEAEIWVNGELYEWEYDLLKQDRRYVMWRVTNLECAIAYAARDYYTNVEPL